MLYGKSLAIGMGVQKYKPRSSPYTWEQERVRLYAQTEMLLHDADVTIERSKQLVAQTRALLDEHKKNRAKLYILDPDGEWKAS